jgi:hypothetical protein
MLADVDRGGINAKGKNAKGKNVGFSLLFVPWTMAL